MTLDLFDDVLGLHFALEAAECIFERLAFLHSNLCQIRNTSQSGLIGYENKDTPVTGRMEPK